MKMKMGDNKEEVTHDMEKLRKKNETDAKHNGRPLHQTRTESQNLKMKWKLKEKLKS
jgi:hypothetical protein